MTDSPPTQSTRDTGAGKLLGRTHVKVRLAVASAALLVIGALLAPRTTRSSLPVPEERPAPLLEEQVQRREPARLVAAVQDIAERVALFTVGIVPTEVPPVHVQPDVAGSITAIQQPAGFGLVVSPDGDVLTHSSALGRRSRLRVTTATGAQADAELTAYEPHTGLALLRVLAPGPHSASPLSREAAQPGSLAAGVGRWQDQSVVMPLFVTMVGTDAYTFGGMPPPGFPGLPIFNVDGEALAIVGGHAGMAFAAREALDRLTARVVAGVGRPASLGVTFQAVEPALVPVFGERGALVSDVIEDGPAATAGVSPGDVLVALGDTTVDSPEAARAALARLPEGAAVTLHILRDGRPLALQGTTGSAFELEPSRRTRPNRDQTAGVVVDNLFTPSEVTRFGIPAGARVLAINGRRVTSRAEALGAMRRTARATLLYLEHEGLRFFARIEERP